MRYFLSGFLFVILIFSFFLGRIVCHKIHREKRKTLGIVKPMIPNENKKFVIVVTSYNNAKWCKKNLESIFFQKYNNFRVIFIDDASTDGTAELVSELIQTSKTKDRIIFSQNRKNIGALANQYRAITSCEDDEIIVLVDGDDFLAHPNVLQTLNSYYANNDIWMTYGQYLDYPSYECGICSPFPKGRIKRKGFREYPFVSSHLRTFYAGLFKKIQYKDFLYKGNFYPIASDYVIMYPLLEMAKGHFAYIPEVLYLQNSMHSINDDKINLSLKEVANKIRKKKKYNKIHINPFWNNQKTENVLDNLSIIIFSKNYNSLDKCLKSIDQRINFCDELIVFYFEKSDEVIYLKKLIKQYPNISFINTFKFSVENVIKAILLDKLDEKLIFLLNENSFFSQGVDLKKCIDCKRKTNARFCCFSSNQNRESLGLAYLPYFCRKNDQLFQEIISNQEFNGIILEKKEMQKIADQLNDFPKLTLLDEMLAKQDRIVCYDDMLIHDGSTK